MLIEKIYFYYYNVIIRTLLLLSDSGRIFSALPIRRIEQMVLRKEALHAFHVFLCFLAVALAASGQHKADQTDRSGKRGDVVARVHLADHGKICLCGDRAEHRIGKSDVRHTTHICILRNQHRVRRIAGNEKEINKSFGVMRMESS